MNDRPTPETDELIAFGWDAEDRNDFIVPAYFARQLERQRDELLDACKECDEAFGKFCPDPDSRYGMAWQAVKAAIASVKGEKR
jgi:hypothetical protein